MYLNNCASVDYMRKRINYETSTIIALDPIEVFIYVIITVCGRSRIPIIISCRDTRGSAVCFAISGSQPAGFAARRGARSFSPLARIWQKARARFVRHYRVWTI